MKIYNKLILDIETGNILEEDSYEHSGSVAYCKGGTAPVIMLPDKTERALNKEQLEILKEERAASKEMEPFTLEAMGLIRNAETGKIEKSGAVKPEDLMIEKNLAMAGYDKAGNRLTEEQILGYMTPAERSTYELTKANNERTMKAYKGELDISPALEAELTAEEKQATEMLQRKLGADWYLSTSGQNMMKQIKQKGNLVREEARRGQITTGEGVAASQANRTALEGNNRSSLAQLSTGISNDKINKIMGYVGSKGVGFNDSMTMSSKLASERANLQNIAMQTAANKANSRTAVTTAGISAVGMAGAAAAAAAAL